MQLDRLGQPELQGYKDLAAISDQPVQLVYRDQLVAVQRVQQDKSDPQAAQGLQVQQGLLGAELLGLLDHREQLDH